MKIKHLFISVYLLAFSTFGFAQQMPFFTQYKNNSFILNPAIAGTKRTIDARIGFRAQWLGYEGAPSTQSISIHSRYLGGKLGTGAYLVQDKIGPFKSSDIGFAAAYHVRYPDVELSMGVGGSFKNYTLIGDKITTQLSQDPAIDKSVNNSTWTPDFNAGIYLYNDRFHMGVSAQNLAENSIEFYKNDSTKKGLVKLVNHINFTLGYNYAQNPDYIFESTFLVNYVAGAPMLLDYTLRLHMKQKMMAGLSLRLGDAAALHLGVTIKDNIQIAYSYDFILSKLNHYSTGSHELMIIYSAKYFGKKRSFLNTQFLHQRYGYIF